LIKFKLGKFNFFYFFLTDNVVKVQPKDSNIAIPKVKSFIVENTGDKASPFAKIQTITKTKEETVSVQNDAFYSVHHRSQSKSRSKSIDIYTSSDLSRFAKSVKQDAVQLKADNLAKRDQSGENQNPSQILKNKPTTNCDQNGAQEKIQDQSKIQPNKNYENKPNQNQKDNKTFGFAMDYETRCERKLLKYRLEMMEKQRLQKEASQKNFNDVVRLHCLPPSYLHQLQEQESKPNNAAWHNKGQFHETFPSPSYQKNKIKPKSKTEKNENRPQTAIPKHIHNLDKTAIPKHIPDLDKIKNIGNTTNKTKTLKHYINESTIFPSQKNPFHPKIHHTSESRELFEPESFALKRFIKSTTTTLTPPNSPFSKSKSSLTTSLTTAPTNPPSFNFFNPIPPKISQETCVQNADLDKSLGLYFSSPLPQISQNEKKEPPLSPPPSCRRRLHFLMDNHETELFPRQKKIYQNNPSPVYVEPPNHPPIDYWNQDSLNLNSLSSLSSVSASSSDSLSSLDSDTSWSSWSGRNNENKNESTEKTKEKEKNQQNEQEKQNKKKKKENEREDSVFGKAPLQSLSSTNQPKTKLSLSSHSKSFHI
jgi:hypothetical protein